MDSNQNVIVHKLVFFLFLGALNLFQPSISFAAYTTEELRAAQTEDESKIRDLRDQEITQLRIALGRRIPNNRRADLYFRLAEIYLEAYRMEFLLEGRVHEKRIKEGKALTTVDRSSSKPFLMSGIKACQDIVKLSASFDKMDRVYYFLGVNYLELGERNEALSYFQGIIRKFPTSPFAAAAYRELGDDAFERRQYPQAIQYYSTAITKDEGENKARNFHKLAWSYYRLKQFDRAIDAMKQGVDYATKSGEKMLSIREEGLRDLAIFMTESGHVEEAIQYFQNVAGDNSYLPKLLERLGKQYERNVEPAKATVVYETLLKTHPKDDAAFRVSVKLIDLDLRRGKTKEALTRVRKMLADKSIPKMGGESETQAALQNLRSMVRRTATESHENYRKTGTTSSILVAEDYYMIYLELLQIEDPRTEAPEIEMYLADVKREVGKSKEASVLYKHVLKSGDKRYAKEAGVLWTASLSDAIRKQSQDSKNIKQDKPSDLEKEFVIAADEMQDNLGEMPEGREAAIKAAQVLAGYKSTLDDAEDRCIRIIKKYPKTNQALTAARLLIQLRADSVANKSKSAKELAETLEEMKSNSVLMATDAETGQGKLKALISEHESRLKVGKIAEAEKEKDFEAAAKGYEQFAAESNKREVIEKAYSNAVISYLKAGNSESATRVVGLWLNKYPDSSQANESIRSGATLALIQGRFKQAGDLFEILGTKAKQPESLKTAARIFQGNAEIQRARESWFKYLKLYPKASDRWTIGLGLAQSQESDKQDESAVKNYRYCMSGPPEFEDECGARLADHYLKARDVEQAKRLYRKIAARRGKVLSPFVAYARFKLGELLEEESQFDPLQLPEANLKKALNQRLTFMETLSRAYMAALEAGGPWAIASLDRLATWAFQFAADIEAITAPDKMEGTELANFNRNLNQIAEPIRKKAVDVWADAYRTAIQQEIFSSSLPTIADRLADARDEVPHRAQGARFKFRLSGVPADGGEGGRQAAFEKVREKLTKNSQDAMAWVDYGNLLWGEGKPLLAKISYDRALELEPKNVSALNNRAVVTVSGTAEEDWYRVIEGVSLLQQAMSKDPQFLPSKLNYALLLTYYRIFSKAKPLWESIQNKLPLADVWDGLAITYQGLGLGANSENAFKKAKAAGASPKRFAILFHEAAKKAAKSSKGASKCIDSLSDLEEPAIGGFEKLAVDHLRKACQSWKSE